MNFISKERKFVCSGSLQEFQKKLTISKVFNLVSLKTETEFDCKFVFKEKSNPFTQRRFRSKIKISGKAFQKGHLVVIEIKQSFFIEKDISIFLIIVGLFLNIVAIKINSLGLSLSTFFGALTFWSINQHEKEIIQTFEEVFDLKEIF